MFKLNKSVFLNPTTIRSSKGYIITISEVQTIATSIVIKKSECEGRIDSALKEIPFLKELRTKLLESHPEWDIEISPPRATCDMIINSIRINLKLTDCKSPDNAMSKASIYYSITGSTTYPFSSNWNEFLDRLLHAKSAGLIKIQRDKSSEYHYLVKNKVSGEVILKPIFDIHTYVSNASNALQINWKNEFKYSNNSIDKINYLKKVESLLVCIQKSVQHMIKRSNRFADVDVSSLLSTEDKVG